MVYVLLFHVFVRCQVVYYVNTPSRELRDSLSLVRIFIVSSSYCCYVLISDPVSLLAGEAQEASTVVRPVLT